MWDTNETFILYCEKLLVFKSCWIFPHGKENRLYLFSHKKQIYNMKTTSPRAKINIIPPMRRIESDW